jgi:hypothetical protein
MGGLWRARLITQAQIRLKKGQITLAQPLQQSVLERDPLLEWSIFLPHPSARQLSTSFIAVPFRREED